MACRSRTALDAVCDPVRQWAIYRSAHGSVHLAIDRVLLSLTEDEFRALQILMCRAHQRFHPTEQDEWSDQTH